VTEAVPAMTIVEAKSAEQIAQARELFLEYAKSLGSVCVSKALIRNWLNCPVTMLHPKGVCCSPKTTASQPAV